MQADPSLDPAPASPLSSHRRHGAGKWCPEEGGTTQVRECWGNYPGVAQGDVDHFEMSVRPVKLFRFTDFVVEPPGLPAEIENQPSGSTPEGSP